MRLCVGEQCVFGGGRIQNDYLKRKTWTKLWKTKAFVIKSGKMAFGHATNIIGRQALFFLTKNAKKLTSLIIGRIMTGRRHGTFIYFWISCYCSRTQKKVIGLKSSGKAWLLISSSAHDKSYIFTANYSFCITIDLCSRKDKLSFRKYYVTSNKGVFTIDSIESFHHKTYRQKIKKNM